MVLGGVVYANMRSSLNDFSFYTHVSLVIITISNFGGFVTKGGVGVYGVLGCHRI